MASEVDICNLSMSHIGQDAAIVAISPPDGSFEADKCATFYPIARDELLERHAWSFCVTRTTLSQLATNPSAIWAYAYSLPNGCIRPLAVLLPNETDDTNTQPFTVETLLADGSAVLYTNVASAVIKYKVMQRDTTKFSPMFVTALSYLLAAYVAGPITKDLKLKKDMELKAEAQFLNASASDMNSEKNNAHTEERVPAHMKARE